MNFDFYLFGNPSNKYDQIPNDYIASKVAIFLKDFKSSRLVIVRQMDLMHYIYVEKLDKTKFIGFCLIFNKVYSSHPKQLVSLFRDLIEDYLVKKGDILRYSKEGELQYVVQSFSDNVLRYQKLRTLIKEKFENAGAQYGIHELTSIFNGEHSTRISDFNVDEAQITAMSLAYNTLIVDDTEGLQQGYIPQLITELHNTIQQLSEQNSKLKARNDTLKRQKKQTTVVAILSVVMAIVLIWFLSFANDKNATIRQQNSEISSLNKHVSSLKNDSSYLEQTLYETKLELKSKKEELKTANEEKTRFEKRDKENQRLITAQKQTIARLEQTKSEQASMISNLQNRLNGTTYSSNTNSSSTSSQRYTSSSSKSVGASTYKMGQNFDATYCLWLYARKSIKINSFYVKADKTGYITIGLYNANNRLEASEKFYIGQAKTAVRLNPSNFKITKSGYYYLAIVQSNGMGLCYHSSNANEYASWQSGNLQVTGANTKGKTSYDDKNKRSYYQYFYSIEYTDY